jgi:GNAT superfamily N-acetyltransferase
MSAGMKIIDLTPENEKSYFLCLEDWSADAKEAGNRRELWYGKMRDKGLRVKLALDDQGIPGGMIQYLPIEQSTAKGEGLYFVNCVWVHGYKQGRGNFQKKGMGEALLKAAEEDARSLGAQGLAAWGLVLPFWMKVSWYKKHGYKSADRDGIMGLVWKPFTSQSQPPKWIKRIKKPGKTPGVVTVTCFVNGWCLAQNLVCERAKRAAGELGAKVVYQEIDTSERSNFMEWGISDGLFIDGKEVRTGPPPSYEKVYKAIQSKVKKL